MQDRQLKRQPNKKPAVTIELSAGYAFVLWYLQNWKLQPGHINFIDI